MSNKHTVTFDFDNLTAYIEDTKHEIVLDKIKGEDKWDSVTRLFTKVEAILTTHNQIEEIKKRVEKETKNYLKNGEFIKEIEDFKNGV
jgi:Na+-transporting NADH:ubiquinone oxidoreductase subunit NqrF